MRLFIAVFPSTDCAEPLREVMSGLKQSCPNGRWVRPESAHFTLAFLGEVPEEAVEKAAHALSRTGAQIDPFKLTFGEAGAFDSWDRPRIVWIGLRDGAEPLARLASVVRAELSSEGLAFDSKPFVPHLTLGRIPDGRPSPELQEQAELAVRSVHFPEMTVDRFDLVSSRTAFAGPVYTTIRRQPLGIGIK